MAKQVIIAAMEEVLGEYILNISRDNLKIAALRGQISLTNVQLDGDLIGSHVLGAVGLSSFGVVSCAAESIKISVPWKTLEQEPTKVQIVGVHLVCIPLTTATAHQRFGAGTSVDPRCSLRTRAKRLVLARLERNFWNGQIPNEGPVMKRIQRAVKEVERDLKRNKGRWRMSDKSTSATDDMDEVLDHLVYNLADSPSRHDRESDVESSTSVDEIPELPRDWKVRLREKVMRNIEATIQDVHIRCEIPGAETTQTDRKSPRETAVAMGFTMGSAIVRTANERWEVGRHDHPGPMPQSEQDHLGPNPYLVHNNKIGFFRDLSVYFDDDPPVLLSQTDALKGNYHKLSPEKIQHRVGKAMGDMMTKLIPKETLREELGIDSERVAEAEGAEHNYICESLEAEVRMRTSERSEPGPISCGASVLPFSFTFNIRPQHLIQYQRLRAAVNLQRRLDTMLRPRPNEPPLGNPRAWWKYAISCVMSRPNSRPWEDIKQIGKFRRRYIDLVSKKNSKHHDGNGHHAGLNSKESAELLLIEDALPIEALLSFHLIALRKAFAHRQKNTFRIPTSLSSSSTAKSKSKSSSRFRILRPGSSPSKKRSDVQYGGLESDWKDEHATGNDFVPENSYDESLKSVSILEAMTLRLGKKKWFIDWKLLGANFNVIIGRERSDHRALNLVVQANGNARSFGLGKRDFSFALTKCEMFHGTDKVVYICAAPDDEDVFLLEDDSDLDTDDLTDTSQVFAFTESSSASQDGTPRPTGPDMETPSTFLDLPREGTVCQLRMGKCDDVVNLSMSAHPATLVWTTLLFDHVAEFFVNSTFEEQEDLAQQVRNAATPLARKAQLALLSPSSLKVHLNIAGPKLWVPLVSENKEGTLFLDAGTIRMAGVKEEGEPDVRWDVEAGDIGVSFVHGANLSRSSEAHLYRLSLGTPGVNRHETTVIQRFSINVASLSSSGASHGISSSESVRQIEVNITPICLNLVDAEMLARSFGKWYARGLHFVRRRMHQTESADPRTRRAQVPDTLGRGLTDLAQQPRIVSLAIEKIEIALEGHSKRMMGGMSDSKRLGSYSDERSQYSLDSFQDFAPPTRAYLVQVFDITLKRSHLQQTDKTELFIRDASIIRLRDVGLYTPLNVRKEAVEPENCILSYITSRTDSIAEGDESSDSAETDSDVLRLSLVHNRLSHLDEVEVDVESIVLRVTPTTLKDCAKVCRRIVELAQLATKEMERKVHEQGRKARRKNRGRDGDGSLLSSIGPSVLDRPVSPTFSEAFTTFTEVSVYEKAVSTPSQSFDSSFLLRVTMNDCTLLAGRPMSSSDQTNVTASAQTSFAVIQVLSNALVMFQSIENPDATGTKTLHVSVDNVTASVANRFERVSAEKAPPMIEPTGAEFRVAYSTENFGCIVSQDISVDCDSIRSCLTPADLSILANVSKTMISRLRAFSSPSTSSSNTRRRTKGGVSAMLRYQKKGTGIATRLRMEVQHFSFILLRSYKSQFGAPQFLDFRVKEAKCLLEGCISAMSGECTARISVNLFHSEVPCWEYVVEPFSITLGVEQMPNEVVLNISPGSPVQLNLTGRLLRDLAEMRFDLSRHQHQSDNAAVADLAPAVLSTVGLRQASSTQSVRIENLSGLDLVLVYEDSSRPHEERQKVKNGKSAVFSAVSGEPGCLGSFTLQLAQSSISRVGERSPITSLPLSNVEEPQIFLLKPTTTVASLLALREEALQELDQSTSPEVLVSEFSSLDNAEPVVEWCMQNQRLKSSVTDVFSLPKGHDLLSSQVWSPEDENHQGTNILADFFANQDSLSAENPEAAAGGEKEMPSSPQRVVTTTSCHLSSKSNWSKPYLKSDVPEWTDMTCTQTLTKEQVMLPNSKWKWVDEWNVDRCGKLGESIDADGWSYEVDFETFSREKRYYERGDLCRRRRWTRTRILNPPKLNDPLQTFKLVWQLARDENGFSSVTLRSHVRIRNITSSPLTFFSYSPSWENDILIGTCAPESVLQVPLPLSSAVYMRLAKMTGARDPKSLDDCVYGDRFSVVPSSHTSTKCFRTFIELKDVSSTTLHFLVEIKSDRGIIDVVVKPVFKLINLLPCQLDCKVGHILHTKIVHKNKDVSTKKGSVKKVSKTEALYVSSGETVSCTAVNPLLKPHLSLRVPGYEWSSWKRVVNRKVDATWRSTEREEALDFSSKGDEEFADEFKTVVRFERLGEGGDPLVVIVSVKCGHCPTVRVYAQYWIVDRTGFGCCFAEGFADILGSEPDPMTLRRSYIRRDESKVRAIQDDMTIPGYQWSMGASGMSLYFSQKERLTLVIQVGAARVPPKSKRSTSQWISPLDISNVIPKTVFFVDELNGHRRFELAINVAHCPGLFGRTKLISLLPRYQVVNLLHRELVIAQDGCLGMETLIPSRSSMHFHWENSSMPPKVRLGAPSTEERVRGSYKESWTKGRLQLDRVGITSLRLPKHQEIPMVVQAEVRLATKDQLCAVVVVIWSGSEKTYPLYTLRNQTNHSILCRQPLQDEEGDLAKSAKDIPGVDSCAPTEGNTSFECGAEFGPIIRSFLGIDRIEEFVWVLKPNQSLTFGFDDPEKLHILEWTYVTSSKAQFEKALKKAFVEVDAMGSSSSLCLPGGPQVRCNIKAEYSTKVIEFSEISEISPLGLPSLRQTGLHFHEILDSQISMAESKAEDTEEEENATLSVRVDIPALSVSVVDDIDPSIFGREIMLIQFERTFVAFSQTREGYQEFEARLMAFQADNHVHKSIHPVMIFCPQTDDAEPLLHISAVRRLHDNSAFVFRYVAIRLLEIEIYLDRRTAEAMARFIQPLTANYAEGSFTNTSDWVNKLLVSMEKNFSKPDQTKPRSIDTAVTACNSNRIYLEQLHLHPVRISFTFTQEWLDAGEGTDTVLLFQFIRGMASIAKAPLVFTSFVVGHVFESPNTLIRIIATHYSSQLTKQVFGILGSLAILGAPADFISNVGTGVRDFFYEPIQGAVHGPRQFIEGLEAGTQSLARGVFVGVVRGAANVAEAVNSNLAGLTADEDFIDERKAHQRMLTDAMSRGATGRSLTDSLNLAGASVVRGFKSGVMGIIEQPSMYASKHGPVGFLKGIGKAVVGVVVKPVVGLGDGAVLVMKHVSDATSMQPLRPKIPKRLRRALPSLLPGKRNCVSLTPYDERGAKAQKIVTGGESVEDTYLGHINLSSHLIIASVQCLWAIDRRSREPWCVSWDEISHFGLWEGGIRIVVFSQTGLKTYLFQTETPVASEDFHKLLSMQLQKMANASDLNSSLLSAGPEDLSRHKIAGMKARQVNHIFGSFNNTRRRLVVNDEVELIHKAKSRMRRIESTSSTYLKSLDEEAWSLVSLFGQVFSGLSSRRCIVAGLINGTGGPIQIKSTDLIEGDSLCYFLSTKEFDAEQGILHAGGASILFGWGVAPNLVQSGSVFARIETNGFISEVADKKGSSTYAMALPGYQVGFLEKSYDDSGWWAKYWLLVRCDS